VIVVDVGNIGGRASIEGRTWSAALEPVRQLLQDATDRLFIHGGIPDDDEFVVSQLAATLPLRVVSRSPSPTDPEAVELVGVDLGTD
jgi:hypothetical protein